MIRSTTLFLLLAATLTAAKAQTTAMDFNMNDCNGNMHHLFSELDSGNAVILEFFMTNCSPCIEAGDKMEPMYEDIRAEHGNRVRFYHFAYSNNYTCSTIVNWVSSNGFNSVPFDSGAAQVAYYGGFGMPTVVVVAGPDHEVLFSTTGFSASDTGTIGTALREFLDTDDTTTIISDPPAADFSPLFVYPNPSVSGATLSAHVKDQGHYTIEMWNTLGERSITIFTGFLPQGTFRQPLETGSLDNGLYFVRISNGEFHTVQPFVVAH